IILDESQQIKNPSTRIAKAVYSLKAKNKLVMTGTPIENNLVELWSQFSFLNPGFLGKFDFFKNNFLKKISEEKDKEKMLALKNMINPFLLMRKKKLVAKELPEKQISILYCEMNEKQRKFYEIWKNKIREEIKDAIEEGGFLNAKLKILQGLTRLRQICNHPKLVDESYIGSSSKIDLIFDQIQEIIEEGHKILIFSSFIGMLKIVKEKFDVLNIDYSYLDGQSKNRQDIVNEFIENEKKKIFLISIKAGGLGLNLTVADYVFIIDPWWNPAIEMQAIDRVHRIGQKKNVFVYKTIVKDSVEEKIIELQESKKELIENLISSEEGIFKNLNQKDIDKIFQ
ncbi:DEAD/DEAH box helicase, partial [bacterium]|nr:DEAD/DEAH box helicase [bacterium]